MVSRFRLLLVLFFVFISQSNSIAQVDSLEGTFFAALERYQEQDSFVAYVDEMKALKKHYDEYFKKLKKIDGGGQSRPEKMMALFENYKIYRDPISDEEKLSARWYYATKFYWTRTTTGDYRKSLEIGLEGAKYAVDPILLDKFAFSIEMAIGDTYSRLDDFSRAKLYHEKCIPGFIERKNFKKLAKLYATVGDVYNWLKNYHKALVNFNKGMALSKEIECYDCLLANHTGLVERAYRAGNKKLFLKLANENIRLLDAQKDNPKKIKRIAELNDALGIYYFNEKEYAKALPYFQKIKSHNQQKSPSKLNRERAKISIKIAQCHSALNNSKEFRKELAYCNQCLISNFEGICPPDSLLYAENSFLEIYNISSDYFLKQFHQDGSTAALDTSLLFINKVIKVGELLDQSIIYSDSKSNFANESKEYVDKAIEIAFLKHENNGQNSDDLSWVRTLFNASKDQILNDKLDLQFRIKNLDKPNKNRVDSLVSVIVEELSSDQGNNSRVLECQDKIDHITGSSISTQKYTGLKSNYVEYLVTTDRLYLLSRMDQQMQFRKLGTRFFLDSLIRAFNHEIRENQNIEKTNAILSKLGNFLLPKELNLSESFTVIPDQNITTIPIDLLRINDKYVIEDHITSISTHFLQKPTVNHKEDLKILCINPEYDFKTDLADNELDRSGFYPLPFAPEEVKSIKSLFSTSVEFIKEGKPSTLPSKLEDVNIFHFTGHAKVNQDSAYLVLNSDEGIVKWTYDQIYHNNFDLRLVTLSACETGLGEVQYGDGLNSIARSFLASGADAVVYSLWTVNDMSTASIMKKFYSELKNGSTKNEALRTAKLTYLNSASPDNRHPYYWGGFVAAGNMIPLQITQGFNNNYLYFLAIILFIPGVILYKTFKTKQL